MSSPFSDRSMITDPARFFGRVDEKRAIFNALAAPKPQCVSIIGERRIGRSSLLKHIEQTYRQHLPRAHDYHFAYLDLARDTCRTPDEFYAETAQALFGNRYDSLTPHEFDDLLDSQNPTRRLHYVLLLDEFNTLQKRRDEFDDDFYNGLRARANAGELTIVLASHVPLHKIAVQNGFTSTFFGIFTPVFLKAFTRSEARRSVLRSATPPLRPADFDVIVRWLNRKYHPLKLNMAADLIWNALPSPNYARLQQKYEPQVAHAFGHAASNLRRQTERQAKWANRCQSLKESISWWTNNKPYMVLILLLIALLVAFGVVKLDQLIAVVENLGGIPALTPTPTPSLTPMMTPIP